MLNVDKVLMLSWFGHFDPVHMKYTLVVVPAPGKSSADARPIHFC